MRPFRPVASSAHWSSVCRAVFREVRAMARVQALVHGSAVSARAIAIAWTLTLAVLLPISAGAQDTGRDRVLEALESTDRRIEQAEAQVSATNTPTAEAEVSIARDLQSRARAAFSAGL